MGAVLPQREYGRPGGKGLPASGQQGTVQGQGENSATVQADQPRVLRPEWHRYLQAYPSRTAKRDRPTAHPCALLRECLFWPTSLRESVQSGNSRKVVRVARRSSSLWIWRQLHISASSWLKVFTASGPGQRDHACTTGLHGLDLSSMLLYVPVPGDDHPSLAGGFGYPDVIGRGGIADGAGSAGPAALDSATWVAWVGNVSSDSNKDLGQAENVGVEVELDRRRLSRPAHAARAVADVS